MTEIGEKNRDAYLKIINRFWGFEGESKKYIEERTKGTWKFVPEFESLMTTLKAEDQRIRFDVDMSNKTCQSVFKSSDRAYSIFLEKFSHGLKKLKNDYNCSIGYGEFIENIVVFNKNKTKIKKVLETVYTKESPELFLSDFDINTNDKETVSNAIVKVFEYIGSYKKSSKKLQIVFSWNPCDWLLSSTRQPNYTSCFDIDKIDGSNGYQYMTGLPFLCGDRNRFMVYLTDGNKKEFKGINVDYVITRSWVILDKAGNFVVVKWYPNTTFDIEAIKAITGIGNITSSGSFQGGKYELDPLNINGTIISVYNDMGEWSMKGKHLFHTNNEEKSGQQIFTTNGTSAKEASGSYCFHFDRDFIDNFRLSSWEKNGWKMTYFFKKYTCSSCGKEDTGFFIKNPEKAKEDCYRNLFLCHDCYADKIYKCSHCGSVYFKDDKNSVKQHSIKTKDGVIEVCESCYNSMKNHICSVCGTYSDSNLNTRDGKIICEDCCNLPNSLYKKCGECGAVVNNYKTVYNDYTKELQFRCEEHSKNPFEYSANYFGSTFNLIMRGRIKDAQRIE